MELGFALEGAEHRQHGIDLRNHVHQFLDIDIQHVVVEAHIYVIASWGAVHGSELEFGCIADEAHLFEYECTVLDIYSSAQVGGCLIEQMGFFDLGVECQVHIGRHEEWFCGFAR